MLRLLLLVAGVVLVLFVLRAFRGVDAGKGGEVPVSRRRMTREEALAVLDLPEGASKDEILKAYRNLMRKVHPDTPGGSTYLASQVNQAKRVLLD